MKFSPEILMAYVDGEFDAATRREIEAAMAEDPAVAAEVARHRALRDQLRGAFSGVLDEAVPSRLIDAANNSPAGATASVTELASARAKKEERTARVRWSWPEWTSIAASLLIGVIGGRALLQGESSNLLTTGSGQLVASGALASALSAQVGDAIDTRGNVRIGLSFRTKDGNYCRTFALQGDATAGVACRNADQWQIEALARVQADAATSDFRQAATALPPVILAVVENEIDGEALDAEQEADARARDWSATRER